MNLKTKSLGGLFSPASNRPLICLFRVAAELWAGLKIYKNQSLYDVFHLLQPPELLVMLEMLVKLNTLVFES